MDAPTPWLLTITLMVGTLAAVMGMSSVNTALPDIMRGLALAPDQASWVTTSYMLANLIAIPSAAWLGARLSPKGLFGAGVAGFMAFSVLCGLATSYEMLIACRVLAGLFGGVIIPTAQTMLFVAFPADKRGLAMGIFGMGAIMGPAIGPTLGGWLVSLSSWRAIFFVNLPFGLVSLAMLGTLPTAERRTDLPFDAPGFMAMAIALTTLQLGVTNGATAGWTSPAILGCLAAAALSLGYLLRRELRIEKPLLDLRVFTWPLYVGATVVSALLGLGLFGSTFLVPLYLGTVAHYNALEIGFILLPGTLVMGVTMLVAGRLSDLVDGRLLLVGGLAIFGWGLHMQATAAVDSPTALHVWAQVWRGLGMAMCFTPLTQISLAGMPPGMFAQATGLFNLTRQLAGMIGIAALSTLLAARWPYATLFEACTALVVLGIVPTLWLRVRAGSPGSA